MSALPILTFHSLDDSGSVVSLHPERFGELMRRLAERGQRGVSLEEALAPTDRGDDGRLFAITFDDGYRNLLERALPTLRELGFTATVFVVAGRLGEDNRWPAGPDDGVPTLELAGEAELRELMTAGWEIGSHGLSHRTLTELDERELERELADSRERLETTFEVPVRHFAYPYGRHDRRVRAQTGRHYSGAVGTRLAHCEQVDRDVPFALPRIDAHYLRRWNGEPLFRDLTGRCYLTVRRWARALRGVGS